jgi:hypothetical protein
VPSKYTTDFLPVLYINILCQFKNLESGLWHKWLIFHSM